MTLNNTSIARKANIVLLFAIIVIIFIIAFVYSSFTFFSLQVERSRKITIPSLMHVTNLAQQGQWLQVQMEQSISTNNPLIQQRIVEYIQNNNSYKAPLQALQTLENNSQFSEKLESEFIKLHQQILTTLNTKNEIFLVKEKNNHIVGRLTKLLQRVAAVEQSETDILVNITIQLIGKLLSIQASTEPWLVEGLGKECALLFQQGNALVAQQSHRGGEFSNRATYLELRNLFYKEKGLLENKKRELLLYREFVQRKSQAVFTATTIVQKCNALLDQSGFDLQSRQENIATQFSLMKHSTFSFLLLLLFFFFSMYAFLHRRILRPLEKLNKAIGQRTKEVQAGRKGISSLPTNGDREIKEISQSTTYFIQEIESQREALTASHAHLEQQVKKRTERIADLSTKIITIQEEEGKRIAAELHDDIGATMSVVKLGIEHVARLLAQPNPDHDQLQISLKKLKQMVQHVTTRLRLIQVDLSPPYLDLGFIEALEALCEDYTMLHERIDFDHSFSLKEKEIPKYLHLVIYRIIQEGLTNIVKHSQATKAALSLSGEGDVIVLRIKDNGIPFPDNPQATGMGLKNIEGRALISHGVVEYLQEGEWKLLQICWPFSYPTKEEP